MAGSIAYFAGDGDGWWGELVLSCRGDLIVKNLAGEAAGVSGRSSRIEAPLRAVGESSIFKSNQKISREHVQDGKALRVSESKLISSLFTSSVP